MYSYFKNTSLGKITITADKNAITRLRFGVLDDDSEIKETELINTAFLQLDEYLDGRRKRFNLPLLPQGTEFQLIVLNKIQSIPYARTRSYKEIAKAAGNEKACRAVGMAANKNPIPIFIPCHRIIGSNGSLVGYAGGLDIKTKLLELESSNSRYFEFGEAELSYLKSKDKCLGKIIDSIQKPEYEVIPDLFTALVYNIIGQQISMKAVETVWQRFLCKFGEITPSLIVKLPDDQLQSIGISMRKVQYIKDSAAKILNGELDIERLKTLPDEELCNELSKLRGIGKWTAEMLMIFSLERSDILSYEDLGIRRGICRLYKINELDSETFEKFRQKYSPYGTIASFYLWSVK